MFNPDLFLPLADLNQILFISFGIWFTLVCLTKMVETAIWMHLPDDPDQR